jgi:hypothetical protein
LSAPIDDPNMLYQNVRHDRVELLRTTGDIRVALSLALAGLDDSM